MLVQAATKFGDVFALDAQPGGVRMPAELLEEVGAGSQPVEQVVGFDASRGAVPVIPVKRDDYARATQLLRNLRGGDTDDASVPAITGDDRHVRPFFAFAGQLELFEGAF